MTNANRNWETDAKVLFEEARNYLRNSYVQNGEDFEDVEWNVLPDNFKQAWIIVAQKAYEYYV